MTDAPRRVQLSRAKGWRMPENTVKVDRTSKWGNPCKMRNERDRAAAIAWFIAHVLPGLPVHELRGKNLACWCRLDRECHADVLLKAANS